MRLYSIQKGTCRPGQSEALGAGLKERDAPADSSFLEPGTGRELNNEQAKVFNQCVGRLVYLSHTRADIQFSTRVLASKMSSPTTTSMKWLQRVVGYLLQVPSLGFLIKPIRDGACLGFPGRGDLESRGRIIVESITDADWADHPFSPTSVAVWLQAWFEARAP